MHRDISFQAIPLSPVGSIHVLKGKLARRPIDRIGCGDLLGPTIQPGSLRLAASVDHCAEGHSVLPLGKCPEVKSGFQSVSQLQEETFKATTSKQSTLVLVFGNFNN